MYNMDFTFQPTITKELILSKFSEEQIMEFYLHVPVKNKLFCSPLRDDKHPTCNFYRNKSGTLLFKDFATGQNFNVFSLVQYLYSCGFKEALKIIANDLGIIQSENHQKHLGKINYSPTKITEKDTAKIQVEIQDFTEQDLKWWKKFGITLDILNKFEVYSCKHVFLNNTLFAKYQPQCPIYGYYGGIKGKELWKCYFPKRKEYRFIGNYPSKVLQGYNKLPEKGKLCVITKSLKDVMALYAYSIPACAPNSETVIPSIDIINNLTNRFEYVFALWDNDLTGITFLNKLKRKYPQLHCLIIPKNLKAKDFSDLRAMYGKKKTKQFIIDYLEQFKT